MYIRKDIENDKYSQDRKEKKKQAGHIANQRFVNIEKKVKRIIKVKRGKICPKCGHKPLRKTERMAQRTIIDLVLTKNGLRKTLVQYQGLQGYCIKCQRFYSPPEIRKYRNRELYGDGFKAWLVYQRI